MSKNANKIIVLLCLLGGLASNSKLNQELIKTGQEISVKELSEYGQAGIKFTENNEKSEEEKSEPESQGDSQTDKQIEKLRRELKINEEKTLDFIFPNSAEHLISSVEKVSKSEKEQLLELWRSTISRNRSIQFVISSLSTNPNNQEKNNQIMQVLSRAMFVPFYALASVSQNSLLTGGSAVGARVLGEVVDNHAEDKQITRTDLIVLFMIVDEVAQRLRDSFYAYKNSKIEQEILRQELEPARKDFLMALESENETMIFLTKTIQNDLERKQRENNFAYETKRNNLIELAGEDTVNAVDLYMNLDIKTALKKYFSHDLGI